MQANLPPNCKLTTMDAVLAAGRKSGKVPKMVVPGQDGQPRDPLTHLMYTSGSSGRPKGAEYNEHVFEDFLKVTAHD
jgi:long-subunit acyl-CoA synthetase (AMP-forming)